MEDLHTHTWQGVIMEEVEGVGGEVHKLRKRVEEEVGKREDMEAAWQELERYCFGWLCSCAFSLLTLLFCVLASLLLRGQSAG
jgi:hypothetical protein